ncbi:hypothetical protein TNCV_188801 [Trichonephila clavipes]|nr:hypothetical protein TNCV_188801 [Trichonephila clavipes]
MFDPSSFVNPTPLAHADTSRDVLPRGEDYGAFKLRKHTLVTNGKKDGTRAPSSGRMDTYRVSLPPQWRADVPMSARANPLTWRVTEDFWRLWTRSFSEREPDPLLTECTSGLLVVTEIKENRDK